MRKTDREWKCDLVGLTADDLVVQTAHTEGANAGDAEVGEVFVTLQATGQILFALVDGQGLDELHMRGVGTFDLLA